MKLLYHVAFAISGIISVLQFNQFITTGGLGGLGVLHQLSINSEGSSPNFNQYQGELNILTHAVQKLIILLYI
jgi:hypothetical protein